jgi:hypothetical protein
LLIFVLVSLFGATTTSIYGQEKSGIILEVENITNPQIITFEINDPESKKEICPSDKCIIEYTSDGTFSIPDPETDNYYISFIIDFDLHDDITNANLTPIQKSFVERYQLHVFCSVVDVNNIIEKNGEVIYNCEGETNIQRIHDSYTWVYQSKGIYDTKLENFKVNGEFNRVIDFGK